MQLAEVVRVCRAARSLAEAGRTLFAASRQRMDTHVAGGARWPELVHHPITTSPSACRPTAIQPPLLHDLRARALDRLAVEDWY